MATGTELTGHVSENSRPITLANLRADARRLVTPSATEALRILARHDENWRAAGGAQCLLLLGEGYCGLVVHRQENWQGGLIKWIHGANDLELPMTDWVTRPEVVLDWLRRLHVAGEGA